MEKKKTKLTVTLDSDLMTEVKDIVYDEQKTTPEYTLTQFIRDAIANELSRLKFRQQGSAPGPKKGPRPLRRGRPMRKE